MSKLVIPNECKIVEALAPATDAAGRTSDIISLKNVGKVTVVVHITQGNAATVALTLLQSTDVAGTGSKALAVNVPIWSNLDTSVSDTLVRRADGVSQTTDAAVKNKVVVFEVDASALDVTNGFDCLAISTGASNLANITQAMFIATDLRFQQANPPSIIVD